MLCWRRLYDNSASTLDVVVNRSSSMPHLELLEKSIPFSLCALEQGKNYGQALFTVNQESHQKTVELLLKSMDRKPAEKEPYPLLLPSELWAMARVFSQSFGRLNEVGLARAVWRVEGGV